MRANKCVCGVIIPEGSHVCWCCKNGNTYNTDRAVDVQADVEVNKEESEFYV